MPKNALSRHSVAATLLLTVVLLSSSGCSNAFNNYRNHGLKQKELHNYAGARGAFIEAMQRVPEHAANLCDIADCCVAIAQKYQSRGDMRSAVRELTKATQYYDRAVRSFPGNTRALMGKNHALELKGDSMLALATTQWASEVVGPSAKTQIMLAKEYQERGDADQALLAYRQALAMEPKNPTAHWALGLFYVEIGQIDNGIAHLQEAYRLQPQEAMIRQELTRLGAEVPKIEENKG